LATKFIYMWKSEKGNWVPDKGEKIIVAEQPHVVKWSGTRDGKHIRGISIPRYRIDVLDEGTELTVCGIHCAQDMHYEYVIIEVGNSALRDYGAELIEVPLRYLKEHPDYTYENTYNKKN
jgi:hypothetical protein